MKKSIDCLFRIFLIIALISVYILEPFSAQAASKSEATTLAELRQELKALQKKKKDMENKKNQTESEKNQANKDIYDANKEIENSEAKIALAKLKIEETQKRIEELTEQTEDVLVFYEIMSGDNAYLNFIADASSLTELIIRTDTINQIIEYNKEKLEELDGLIEENEKLQVDMIKYENELNNKIDAYKNKIDELDSSLIEMADISMDIDGEIKLVQASIKNYENMGCGENQKFTACAASAYNSTWLKPIVSGTITSLFGNRYYNGKYSFHSGIDIGVKEGTPVYSSTNGKVVYMVRQSSCGGNQVYIESVVDGVTYTMLYAHLKSINVSLNQDVTNQTIIGYSGGYSTSVSHGGYDRCTGGAHLHFSVSKSKFTTWSNFYAKLINPPGFPGKGTKFFSRTQWFG